MPLNRSTLRSGREKLLTGNLHQFVIPTNLNISDGRASSRLSEYLGTTLSKTCKDNQFIGIIESNKC